MIRPGCLLHAIIPTVGGRSIANDYYLEIVPNRKSILEKTHIKEEPKSIEDIHGWIGVLSTDASGNYQLLPAAY